MDEETTTKALRIFDMEYNFIGYPAFLENDSAIVDHYNNATWPD